MQCEGLNPIHTISAQHRTTTLTPLLFAHTTPRDKTQVRQTLPDLSDEIYSALRWLTILGQCASIAILTSFVQLLININKWFTVIDNLI